MSDALRQPSACIAQITFMKKDNIMATQKQVEARYPYMFAGRNIGISIPRGWIGIFATLCSEIDELLGSDKQGFYWRQCKEKFGSARWYWAMKGMTSAVRIDLIAPAGVSSFTSAAKSRKPEGAALSSQLSELIDAAAHKTTHSCIVCGQQGKNDRGDGWFVVLCPEHTRMRAENRLPLIWFEEDDE